MVYGNVLYVYVQFYVVPCGIWYVVSTTYIHTKVHTLIFFYSTSTTYLCHLRYMYDV